MTPLRKRFIELMELKGYTEHTIKNYVQAVSFFARYHNKSPHCMSTDDITSFLIYMKRVRKIAPRTFNIYYYGITIFYKLVMPDYTIRVPFKRLRVKESLPVIPSKQEVAMLLDAAENVRDRALIALLYSSGIRLQECYNLKLTDIDSKRMVIFIEKGKGKKDRYTILSEKVLHLLRNYVKITNLTISCLKDTRKNNFQNVLSEEL